MPLMKSREGEDQPPRQRSNDRRCHAMRYVSQRVAVAANRSQAVAQGAVGPKLTEGVSGSDSGHDPTSQNFRVPDRPSAHPSWRQMGRAEVKCSAGIIVC